MTQTCSLNIVIKVRVNLQTTFIDEQKEKNNNTNLFRNCSEQWMTIPCNRFSPKTNATKIMVKEYFWFCFLHFRSTVQHQLSIKDYEVREKVPLEAERTRRNSNFQAFSQILLGQNSSGKWRMCCYKLNTHYARGNGEPDSPRVNRVSFRGIQMR